MSSCTARLGAKWNKSLKTIKPNETRERLDSRAPLDCKAAMRTRPVTDGVAAMAAVALLAPCAANLACWRQSNQSSVGRGADLAVQQTGARTLSEVPICVDRFHSRRPWHTAAEATAVERGDLMRVFPQPRLTGALHLLYRQGSLHAPAHHNTLEETCLADSWAPQSLGSQL